MALIFILLYAPIVTLVVLSFNDSKTRAKWGGFTLHWYRSLFANTEIMNALYTTLIIALLASAIATVLGTLACIGINSMSKKSRTVFMGITNIPMLNGEIVMGISLIYHLPHSAWIRYHSDGTYYVQCSLRYLERYAEIKADEQIDVRGSSRSWCLSAVCILESYLPGHHARRCFGLSALLYDVPR